jgi:hypothetical protein
MGGRTNQVGEEGIDCGKKANAFLDWFRSFGLFFTSHGRRTVCPFCTRI